jgi:hypothetical protein
MVGQDITATWHPTILADRNLVGFVEGHGGSDASSAAHGRTGPDGWNGEQVTLARTKSPKLSG